MARTEGRPRGGRPRAARPAMPGIPLLCWPGKEAARARAVAALRDPVEFRRLDSRPGPAGRESPAPGRRATGAERAITGRDTVRGAAAPWRDRLVHGDNLEVMASLAAELAGRVDLVYADPPFATGGSFVLRGRTAAGTRAFRDDWGGSGATSAWLGMMLPRLELVHALLSERGCLYVHVDHRTAAHVRLLLDEVFGPGAMRGWIAWHTGAGAKGRRRWSQQHNDLLCYVKGSEFAFDTDATEMREPFAATSLAMHFDRVDDGGRRYRERVVNGRRYVYWADRGRLVGSVWTDCPSMAANSPILPESTGYPTQKPERLLQRILAASSRPGDLVADFFCGSGTTLAVAARMGRRWIGCDRSGAAISIARDRLLREARGGFDVLACSTRGSAPARAGRRS